MLDKRKIIIVSIPNPNPIIRKVNSSLLSSGGTLAQHSTGLAILTPQDAHHHNCEEADIDSIPSKVLH